MPRKKTEAPKAPEAVTEETAETKKSKKLAIVSKSLEKLCYILEDGTHVPYSELKEFFTKPGMISPPHKKGDFMEKVDGKWVLSFGE